MCFLSDLQSGMVHIILLFLFVRTLAMFVKWRGQTNSELGFRFRLSSYAAWDSRWDFISQWLHLDFFINEQWRLACNILSYRTINLVYLDPTLITAVISFVINNWLTAALHDKHTLWNVTIKKQFCLIMSTAVLDTLLLSHARSAYFEILP